MKTTTDAQYLDVGLVDTSEEEEMVLDPRVGVELLQGQVHSFPVGFGEFIVSPLRVGGNEQSPEAEEEHQQRSHLSPRVCNKGSEGITQRPTHTVLFS